MIAPGNPTCLSPCDPEFDSASMVEFDVTYCFLDPCPTGKKLLGPWMAMKTPDVHLFLAASKIGITVEVEPQVMGGVAYPGNLDIHDGLLDPTHQSLQSSVAICRPFFIV